jgi:hypothetical protein
MQQMKGCLFTHDETFWLEGVLRAATRDEDIVPHLSAAAHLLGRGGGGALHTPAAAAAVLS